MNLLEKFKSTVLNHFELTYFLPFNFRKVNHVEMNSIDFNKDNFQLNFVNWSGNKNKG
jgi:hypothetical protein